MDSEDLLVYTELNSITTQDFLPYQEASVAGKDETYTEDFFIPGISNGKNLHKQYPSPPMIAEMWSVKNTAWCHVQAPAVYSSNRGQESATGDMSALQTCSPTVSLQHGVAMECSLSPPHSSQKLPEEAACKRELRMKKNREAARVFRRKKKEWIRYLEKHVAVLENQNKNLLEEITALKEAVY